MAVEEPSSDPVPADGSDAPVPAPGSAALRASANTGDKTASALPGVHTARTASVRPDARGRAGRALDRIRPLVRDGDLGRAGIALTLALLTVLAAIVAGLQSHASTMAQRSQREADRLGLAATGQDGAAVLRVGTAYGTYRRWFEQVERSVWANDAVIADPDGPTAGLLRTLAELDQSIADWMTSQSPLLEAPYYDDVARQSDFGFYEGDLLRGPAVRAKELRQAEAAVAARWDERATDYITVLTIVAVGLFFLGLASTVGRRARGILAITGASFGLFSIAWTIAISLAPIHRVPATAIERLVEAEAHQHRAGGTPGEVVSAADRAEFEAAITKATAAIELDPDYVNAYHTRGNARLFYADTLIFSPEGQSQHTTDLLRAAVTDYRTYVMARPDDYAAWWNLGWSAYLQGDVVGSLEATNRAIELAPTQFTLYLNRTLALLAARDEAAALADVRAAIDLASRDDSDSAPWYLGQSDFNIGLLAALHPDHGETLLAIQRELREARVALRVRGDARPSADAPQVGSITVRPIEIGRFAGGTTTELSPLSNGDVIEAPEAVGFRVTVAGSAALSGRTLSARLWVNGHPRSDYRLDIALGPSPPDEITVELMNPYGRAGFDLDAGRYELAVYVDGATRGGLTWTIEPRPSKPMYATTAGPFLQQLAADGFVCEPPEEAEDGSRSICTVRQAGNGFQAEVTVDDQDRFVYVALWAIDEGEPDEATLADQARLFFGYVIRLMYPADLAERAVSWLAEQDRDLNQVELGGTTIRSLEATETLRGLDILGTWPDT